MEGDVFSCYYLRHIADFYPRPHMEGDLHRASSIRDLSNFYPRPHMEGDSSADTSGLNGF